jgi:hypothetical protein
MDGEELKALQYTCTIEKGGPEMSWGEIVELDNRELIINTPTHLVQIAKEIHRKVDFVLRSITGGGWEPLKTTWP